MNSTASGTVALPTPTFSLSTYGAVRQRVADQDSAMQRSAEAAALRAAKAAAKHRLEMKAIEYADILMQRRIDDALDPATDPRLRRDLTNDILNRGIGRVPEAENPDRKKQPGDAPGAANILEALAAISAGQAIVEAARRPQLGHTRDEPIERDITPRLEGDDLVGDWDVDKLLDDIEGLGE